MCDICYMAGAGPVRDWLQQEHAKENRRLVAALDEALRRPINPEPFTKPAPAPRFRVSVPELPAQYRQSKPKPLDPDAVAQIARRWGVPPKVAEPIVQRVVNSMRRKCLGCGLPAPHQGACPRPDLSHRTPQRVR